MSFEETPKDLESTLQVSGTNLNGSPVTQPLTSIRSLFPDILHPDYKNISSNPSSNNNSPTETNRFTSYFNYSQINNTSSFSPQTDSPQFQYPSIFDHLTLPPINNHFVHYNSCPKTHSKPTPLPRPRRRYNDIERNYTCTYPNCGKAYGALNHLNTHIALKKHGPKRSPHEFSSLRQSLRDRELNILYLTRFGIPRP